jgi:HK97 family phage prohead protease
MSKREFRTITAAEIRSNDNGTISGYAAVFNSPADLGSFTESIQKGAFSRCLGEQPDIRCLINHDTSQILGRTRSGTLQVREDERGLYFDCNLPDTQAARDLSTLIKRGDISGMSFGFYIAEDGDDWSRSEDGTITRSLTDCEVFEVSVCPFPAYPATSVSVRSLWPDGIPEAVELRTKEQPAEIVEPPTEVIADTDERDKMLMRVEIAKRK